MSNGLLQERVPWRALVDRARAIVSTHDGALLRTYRLRGPDQEAASEAIQGAVMWQLNNVFKRLGGAWAVWDEAQRREVSSYLEVRSPHPLVRLVEGVRKDTLIAEPGEPPTTFETFYYLTLRWRMPLRMVSWLGRCLLTNPPPSISARGVPADVESFASACDHIAHLLRGVLAVSRPLDAGEMKTYLASTVSDRWHRRAVSRDRRHLREELCDARFVGGWRPMLGEQHLRICSVRNFPETSIAPALRHMDHLPFRFRRVSRLICWDKQVARGVFKRAQHGWLSQEKGPMGIVSEQMGRSPKVIDSHATNRAMDADAARQEVSGEYVGYGHFTKVVMCYGATPDEADGRMAEIRYLFEEEGFSVIVETAHSAQAFFSAVPGNIRDSVRRTPTSTLAFSHWSAGFKAVWPGPERDESLGGDPWIVAQTERSTYFRIINRVNRVGHTLVPGPTGTGKTALLDYGSIAFTARYWPVQIFRFAVGGGEEAITRCLGGHYYNLGVDRQGFQPYRDVHKPAELDYRVAWTLDRLREKLVNLTPTVHTFVRAGLERLAAYEDVSRRTMTGYVYELTDIMRPVEAATRNPNAPNYHRMQALLDDQREATRAMSLYCDTLLDADHDDMADGWYHTFEQETILGQSNFASATFSHIFHGIEARLTGLPTLIEMDEATLPMVVPEMGKALPDWAMTKRKQNCSLIISLPMVALLEAQALRPLLLQSCPTKLLTPNTEALAPDVAKVYTGMGLSEAMITQVASGRPGYEYFYHSPLGWRKFQLDLGGVLSVLCGSSNAPEEQALVAQVRAQYGDEDFAYHWLVARGYLEHAERLHMGTEVSYAAN